MNSAESGRQRLRIVFRHQPAGFAGLRSSEYAMRGRYHGNPYPPSHSVTLPEYLHRKQWRRDDGSKNIGVIPASPSLHGSVRHGI
ncbi:hypothetical protein KCP74_14985 [Salmonella enterica subsp. enterica]|nr:hypothetical protein KCP74_14985 [Salmonella enterica subsp. enterica]